MKEDSDSLRQSEEKREKTKQEIKAAKALAAKQEKAKKARRRRRRFKRFIVFVLILAVLGFAGYAVVQKLKSEYTVNYQAYTATTGTISNSLSFSGTLLAINNTSYTASSDSAVRALYVEKGQDVKEGGYKITVTPTEGKNQNYEITTGDGTFTITPAKISITADDLGKTYDNDETTDPKLTAKESGVPEKGVADRKSKRLNTSHHSSSGMTS